MARIRSGIGQATALPIPVPVIHFLIAERFHRFPWEVEAAPACDVMRTWKLMDIVGPAGGRHEGDL